MEILTDGLIGIFANGHDYITEGMDWWYRGVKEKILYITPSDHTINYKAPISPYIEADARVHEKITAKANITTSVSFLAKIYPTEYKAQLFG